jgi:hypothetical protein
MTAVLLQRGIGVRKKADEALNLLTILLEKKNDFGIFFYPWHCVIEKQEKVCPES